MRRRTHSNKSMILQACAAFSITLLLEGAGTAPANDNTNTLITNVQTSFFETIPTLVVSLYLPLEQDTRLDRS